MVAAKGDEGGVEMAGEPELGGVAGGEVVVVGQGDEFGVIDRQHVDIQAEEAFVGVQVFRAHFLMPPQPDRADVRHFVAKSADWMATFSKTVTEMKRLAAGTAKMVNSWFCDGKLRLSARCWG